MWPAVCATGRWVVLGLFLLAAALEIEASGGAALPSAPTPSVTEKTGVALQIRAGADFMDHVTVSAALLGIPGSDAPTGCSFGSPCSATFTAVSGFGIVRLHTAADLQVFAEAGVGIGKLIGLSASDYFENPPLRGDVGPAFLLGGGGRWFVGRQVALGLEAAWTLWTRVSRPQFVYGATTFPARDDLTVSAVLLLFSVGWSPGR